MLHGNATDWGQDLFRLARWCKQHPERRPLSIATVGYPTILETYGIEADSVRFDMHVHASLDESFQKGPVVANGWHVVSFEHLLDPRSPYHRLLYRTPQDYIGNTHDVHYLEAEEAKRFEQNALPKLWHHLELKHVH